MPEQLRKRTSGDRVWIWGTQRRRRHAVPYQVLVRNSFGRVHSALPPPSPLPTPQAYEVGILHHMPEHQVTIRPEPGHPDHLVNSLSADRAWVGGLRQTDRGQFQFRLWHTEIETVTLCNNVYVLFHEYWRTITAQNQHMGDCQNYGPFLGTLNFKCHIIIAKKRPSF